MFGIAETIKGTLVSAILSQVMSKKTYPKIQIHDLRIDFQNRQEAYRVKLNLMKAFPGLDRIIPEYFRSVFKCRLGSKEYLSIPWINRPSKVLTSQIRTLMYLTSDHWFRNQAKLRLKFQSSKGQIEYKQIQSKLLSKPCLLYPTQNLTRYTEIQNGSPVLVLIVYQVNG